ALAPIIQQNHQRARFVLERLVDTGLAEQRGTPRERHYVLSAAAYRKLGHTAIYTRRQAASQQDDRQLVLQHVSAQGAIRRAEVAALCRMTLPQASYLLQQMTKAGILRLVGSGRSARYELPADRSQTKRAR